MEDTLSVRLTATNPHARLTRCSLIVAARRAKHEVLLGREPVGTPTRNRRIASRIGSLNAEHARKIPRLPGTDICWASARSAHRAVASAFHCTLVWFRLLFRASTCAPQLRHATGFMGIYEAVVEADHRHTEPAASAAKLGSTSFIHAS